LAALRRRHPDREWGFFPELRVGTGYRKTRGRSAKYEPWEQRLDLWVINYFPSRHLERISYEIKTTRGDFLNEIKHPEKRKAAMELSNRFYFVAPEGVLWEGDMPPYCGLLEVREDGSFRLARSAPWRECDKPPWRFVAGLARRVARNG